MSENFFTEATNPRQYDSPEMNWKTEGLKASPSRRLFQEYLSKYLDIKGRSVIDIGSGMGQLFPMLKALGAKSIQGIEPSVNNVDVSRELNPDVPVLNCSLAEMPEDTEFDSVVSVMVFEHIANITEAFKKINRVLAPGGIFYFIVGDIKYHTMPRLDYVIEKQEQGDGVVAVKTIRPRTSGVLYDVLRPLDSYIEAAKASGFALQNHIEIVPTEDYIKAVPKIAQYAGIPICHLLVFSK